jgi:Domain of unknown function (DUF1844)
MNEPKTASGHEPTRDEMMTALFAHLVMQQSNMAMMLMGKAPHPETGQPVRDLESAKLFIDLLEMLEAKTKGNLTKEEQNLLKQTLMAVRMGFVEAVESPGAQSEAKSQAAQSTETGKSAQAEKAPSLEAAASAPEESHKKFTKKY